MNSGQPKSNRGPNGHRQGSQKFLLASGQTLLSRGRGGNSDEKEENLDKSEEVGTPLDGVGKPGGEGSAHWTGLNCFNVQKEGPAKINHVCVGREI